MMGFGIAEIAVVLAMLGGSVAPEPARSLVTTVMRTGMSSGALWLVGRAAPMEVEHAMEAPAVAVPPPPKSP